MSKVIVPKIRMIEKVTMQKIDIDDIVVGKVDIFRLNDDMSAAETMSFDGYNKEKVTLFLPERFIGKKIMIRYDREVNGIKITNDTLGEEYNTVYEGNQWFTREQTYNFPKDTLYLAYQFGYPLRVVQFITGRGMVDVRTDDSCNPTKFMPIELPEEEK